MLQHFISSKNLKGRFAIVKLWPELKAAEDECIARLKIAAQGLGLECVEIYSDGRLVDRPAQTITKNDVDFVLHLHYETPKLYDAFSLVALWNPLELYHKWGYARYSRNLLSHDDFVSCSSDSADHHVGRLIIKSANHLPPTFKMYHSLFDIVHPPTLGDGKLFYAGINWDVLMHGASRHQQLLKFLDESGALRIYGPTLFQNKKVWEGYKSYVKEIPFDGISLVNEINRAGISLVLSSEMHKQSQLMSNRLFESIAAGALVICDENEFSKKFFGDTLLYIDTRYPIEEVAASIFEHMAWAHKNQAAARRKIAEAQQIFRDQFSLKKSLQGLYEGLPDRKLKLQEMNYPTHSGTIKISANFLMLEYDNTILETHLTSIAAQDYTDFSATLVIDKEELNNNRSHLQKAIGKLTIPVRVFAVDYFTHPQKKQRRRIGEIIQQILTKLPKGHDAITFIAPNEILFSNHLRALAGSLARNPALGCAATATILRESDLTYKIHETIDFSQLDPINPIGYGRFIFRISMLANNLHLALPYVDRKSLAILIGENKIQQEACSTIVIKPAPFPADDWNEGQENELISSFCPAVFSVFQGFEIRLPVLSYPSENLRTDSRPKGIKWIIGQIHKLRKQGLLKRTHAMKKKFQKLGASFLIKNE